jgi:hypothetical protein
MKTLIAATLLGSVVHSSAAIAIYDWSTANGSASPGTALNTANGNISGANDGWAYSSRADNFNVINDNQPAGFSGNYVSSNASGFNVDSNASRINDGNFSYSIAPNATEVTISVVMHMDQSNSWGWVGLTNIVNSQPAAQFRIGYFGGNWVYRDHDGGSVALADTGVSAYDGTATSYRATAVFDLVGDTYGYTVENLTDGGSVVLASGAAVATENLDWSNLDSLYMRGRNVSYDDLSIGYVVPEPSSSALLGLGGLALTLRRRR